MIWAIGSQFRGLLIQTRLYFIIFPAWAVLTAAGYTAISRINSHNIRFGKIADTVIVLALAFNLFYTLKAASISNPIPVGLNMESREAYLTRHLGEYQTAMQTITALPENYGLLCSGKLEILNVFQNATRMKLLAAGITTGLFTKPATNWKPGRNKVHPRPAQSKRG